MQYSDSTTTIEQLRERVRVFVDERDWEQFHHPKEVAISVSIEAAELLELFQWETQDRAAMKADDAFVARVGEELADILNYCIIIANQLDIDLATAFFDKIAKNEAKYPVAAVKSRWEPRR